MSEITEHVQEVLARDSLVQDTRGLLRGLVRQYRRWWAWAQVTERAHRIPRYCSDCGRTIETVQDWTPVRWHSRTGRPVTWEWKGTHACPTYPDGRQRRTTVTWPD